MADFASPIHESSHSEVFLVKSSNYHDILHYDSPNIVAMKVLRNELPNPDEIKRFYKEYEILQKISHPRIRRVLGKVKLRNKHTVFLEWVEGVTIREYGRRGVEDFLSLSRQIVEALVELHLHHIVHNNISTHSIMVNPDSGEIKMIELEQCSMIDERIHRLKDPYNLEGDLHFISPDKVVDYRSDLYSLGCIFYFMLTGKIPFESNDQSQLLSMHATCFPPPISEVDPTILAPLSDLVRKLMAKNPENRYQSARGVLYDLNLMLSKLQSGTGIDSDFVLARKDCSGQLLQKLYGRTDQVRMLLSAFDRIREGTSEVVLVSGHSGTGKSSLVNEVHAPVKKTKGYFITGKYYPLQCSGPYSGILQAFTEFCNLLLTESTERFENFRRLIQAALGDEGKILTDVIPKLHSIIGDQPDVPEVGGIEIKNRFKHVFLKFVKAICTANRSILLFVDDLQWADSASLELLSFLMMDSEMKYLLFVGAYRDEEVNDFHPLMTTIINMKNSAITHKIEIGNLGRETVNELISETLNVTGDDTHTLTKLVYGNTIGNAFFVTFFLQSLLEEKLIYFCFDDLKWKWDTDIIWRQDVTQLLSRKIVKLPLETQEVLMIASCLGGHFEVFLLHLITGKEEVKELLEEAIFEGIIIPSTNEDKKSRFSHDRIQEVVYSLIPESDRTAIHLRIGSVLMKKLVDLEKLEEYLFIVVNQLNADLNMIVDKSERTQVATLNFRAARKARLSSSFELAAVFFLAGIKLLGSNHWKEYYDLSLEAYVAAAEMNYCNGDFDQMNELLKEVFENAISVLDKVESFSVQMKAFRAQKRSHDVLDTGIHLLELLGETFSAHPNALMVQLNSLKTKQMTWNKNNDVIASIIPMKDETKIAAVRVMAEMLPSARFVQSQLCPLLACRIVQLTMKYGFTKYAIFGFAWYGQTYVALGNYEEGYRTGQLLLRLLDRFTEKECQCWVYTYINMGFNHWKENIHLSLKPYQKAFQIGREVGETEYSFCASWRYCSHSFLGGNPLVKLEREMRFYCEQYKAYEQNHFLMMLAPFHQAVLNLIGKGSEDPTKLVGEAFNEESMDSSNLKENVFVAVAVPFNCMILAYFFHEYDIAAKRAEETKKLIEKMIIYERSNFVFYHGLISLALARETKNKASIKIAHESISYMKKLAKICPDNFLHKAHLLEAELAVYNHDSKKAMEHFNKAIDLAEAQSFFHEEGLAWERAGIHCMKTNKEFLASTFLSGAYQVYKEWGAFAKAHHLVTLFGSAIASSVPMKRSCKEAYIWMKNA